jgi:DNA-binding NarL/FixJ family response regulator
MLNSIRILVIDDHPVVRDGLIAMLETQPDFVIVGEGASGKDALIQAQQLTPDVILLDLEMPEMDGVEALQALRQASPDVCVIVFTAFDTDDRIVTAIQAGAKGYLLKGAPRNDIFKAIRVVSAGGSLLEPLVASKILQHLSAPERTPPPLIESLTERENDVLELLAQGRKNREIAEQLFITERTVKFHVSAILGKLGASNRTEAVKIAAQYGLIKL